jgi:hypothetical protein
MKPKRKSERPRITAAAAIAIRKEYGPHPRKKLPSMFQLAIKYGLSTSSVWRILAGEVLSVD